MVLVRADDVVVHDCGLELEQVLASICGDAVEHLFFVLGQEAELFVEQVQVLLIFLQYFLMHELAVFFDSFLVGGLSLRFPFFVFSLVLFVLFLRLPLYLLIIHLNGLLLLPLLQLLGDNLRPLRLPLLLRVDHLLQIFHAVQGHACVKDI